MSLWGFCRPTTDKSQMQLLDTKSSQNYISGLICIYQM